MKKISEHSLTYIIGILALIYFSIITGYAAFRNYKTNQQIKKMKVEIETMEIENQNLQNLIAYYQTPAFKEKEARRELGLVKTDEKMLIMTKEPPKSESENKNPNEEKKETKPNYTLWWDFFFKKR